MAMNRGVGDIMSVSNMLCMFYYCDKCQGLVSEKQELTIHRRWCLGDPQVSDCASFACNKKNYLYLLSMMNEQHEKCNEVKNTNSAKYTVVSGRELSLQSEPTSTVRKKENDAADSNVSPAKCKQRKEKKQKNSMQQSRRLEKSSTGDVTVTEIHVAESVTAVNMVNSLFTDTLNTDSVDSIGQQAKYELSQTDPARQSKEGLVTESVNTLATDGDSSSVSNDVSDVTQTYAQSLCEGEVWHWVCDVEGCMFSTPYKRAMDTHKKARHQNEKRYLCTQCPYLTQYKSNLDQHFLLHSGKKDFACKLCDYKGARHADLKSHMVRHCGEKVFQCDQCSYSTRYPQALKKHLMQHYSVKPWQCTDCSYTSIMKAKVTRHIKHKHPFSDAKELFLGIKLDVKTSDYKKACYMKDEMHVLNTDSEDMQVQEETLIVAATEVEAEQVVVINGVMYHGAIVQEKNKPLAEDQVQDVVFMKGADDVQEHIGPEMLFNGTPGIEEKVVVESAEAENQTIRQENQVVLVENVEMNSVQESGLSDQIILVDQNGVVQKVPQDMIITEVVEMLEQDT